MAIGLIRTFQRGDLKGDGFFFVSRRLTIISGFYLKIGVMDRSVLVIHIYQMMNLKGDAIRSTSGANFMSQRSFWTTEVVRHVQQSKLPGALLSMQNILLSWLSLI